MIETQHTVSINTGIDQVWEYVQDIRRWAELFPGCQQCDVVDQNNSRWLIKVGAGGMVKAVNVRVSVEQWNGPQQVVFAYELESEPVLGSGSYQALAQGDRATDVQLHLRVEGSGQMAPMWEAMSKPLLPQMAKSFSSRLKNEIEAAAGIPSVPKLPLLTRFWRWLKNAWSGSV